MMEISTLSSNSIKLEWKSWLLVIIPVAAIIFLTPIIWRGLENFTPSDDYRLPYTLSDDYWMFNRWSRYACSKYPILVMGDSVIWGEYVTPEQTLSHYLNEKKDIFANLGVDGTHPAAISGLVEYYGKSIKKKDVILHLNPLWMSSKRHDLTAEEEFRFNHPRLVPQFIRKPASYNPSFSQKVGILAERDIPFFSLANHVKTMSFDGIDLRNWTMENPYKNPFTAITLTIPAPENSPKSQPEKWSERGMEKQDFSWVKLDESFQWYSYKKVLKTLKARKNNIFVIIGPFNPYILTDESLNRYKAMKNDIEKWLGDEGISYHAFSDLPSEEYADASHPLKDGYARIAEELYQAQPFQEWLEQMIAIRKS